MLRARRGGISVLVAVAIVTLVGVNAVVFDFQRLGALRSELQTSAEAGAHAGAIQLIAPHVPADADDSASSYAIKNLALRHTVRVDSVELGDWDDSTQTFQSTVNGAEVIDAVRIVVSYQSGGLILSMLGKHAPRIRARAVGWVSEAVLPASGSMVARHPIFIR